MGGMARLTQELQYLVHIGRMYDQVIRWRPHPVSEVIGGKQSMVHDRLWQREGCHICVIWRNRRALERKAQ